MENKITEKEMKMVLNGAKTKIIASKYRNGCRGKYIRCCKNNRNLN